MSVGSELAAVLLAHAPALLDGPPREPSYAEAFADRLLADARILASYAEAECSRPVGDDERAGAEAAENAFGVACRQLGCEPLVTGDPRGYVARILFPDGAHNTWGGAESGWGVA